MRILPIELLTRAAFELYGEVIELSGARSFPINLGSTIRYHDLAKVDVSQEGGRPLISLFRGQPRVLPFAVKMMERHPLGSQAFLPLNDHPYLIVVAESGDLAGSRLRGFVTKGWQGVSYARNIWHHPLLALGEISDFIVVDRGGEGVNLVEEDLPEAVWLTESALAVAQAAAA